MRPAASLHAARPLIPAVWLGLEKSSCIRCQQECAVLSGRLFGESGNNIPAWLAYDFACRPACNAGPENGSDY
jgi:hypothetical protein